MSLGTNQHTVTTGNVFRPDIWSKEILRDFEATLVLADKFKRFDQEVASFGKTVTIPKLSNLVANDKIANTEVTLQAPTETSVVITMDQHKHAAFLIEDMLKIQSRYDLMSEYTQKAGYAIRKAVDTSLANLATGFSSNAGTYNTALTEDALLDAVETVDLQDTPQSNRCFFLHPEAVRDLRDIDDYTRFDGIGYAGSFANGSIGSGEKLKDNGMVGRLHNAPVYMTTQIAKSGNNISNIYAHKDAFGLAIQASPRAQSDYQLQLLGNLFVADVLYGVAELRDEAGVELRS